MAVAERELQLLALQRGAVADAGDLELLLEALGDAFHQIRDLGASGSVQRLRTVGLVPRRDLDGAVLELHVDVVVHDELKPAGFFADLKHLKGGRDTNVALTFTLRRGDVDTAFAAADHVFEHTFRMQQVLHLPFEPPVSVAEPGDRSVTIHTASQTPSFVRAEIARLLGWPENRVRVKVGHLGGSFGAKLYIKLEALVTAAALLVRRPVKISLTMEEQFYTVTKHAATLRLKSGVTADGRLTARACEVWWNGGAFAEIGPRVTQKSGFTAAGRTSTAASAEFD